MAEKWAWSLNFSRATARKPPQKILATPLLPAIGFGAAGVAKASVAAGIQSVIVTVGKGSLFAAAQSAGAVGSISSMTGGIVTGIGTAGGAALGAAGSGVSRI